jgi:hypothetical protein
MYGYPKDGHGISNDLVSGLQYKTRTFIQIFEDSPSTQDTAPCPAVRLQNRVRNYPAVDACVAQNRGEKPGI